jgi:3-phenylpropionate/trans-cinnamate dioxygenase ferredoxin reductase subunit
MERFDYLIVGGGMAADAAVKGIRQIDEKGTIGVLSEETDPPYKRPPLSKKLWMGKPEESIWLHTQDQGADLRLGTRVVEVDPGGGRVLDENANEYAYGKLLLATGGTPRRLSPDTEGLIYLRTVPDYHRLRELTERGERFAVIGGGFIGAEIAAALTINNKRVTMIFPSTGIGEKVYPREISSFLVDYYREHGVEVLAGDAPASIRRKGDSYVVESRMGREFTVDGVVVGIGISPNTELAEAAELAVDNGIVVDGFLRASRPGVFAAGDAACFYDMVLNKRRRVEHEDNAVTMGAHAGRAMAGDMAPYAHTPYFYSDLFDLGYEAVGDTDVALETLTDWKEPYKEGVVYYMQDGRVRGVLLWNVWDKVPAATELLADPGPFTADDLKGRIGN